MSKTHPERVPVEINLHRKSRVLAIRFSDGNEFHLPCEYLRVFSKAAEVRAMGKPVTGKEGVNIDRIEPQGQYAVRLIFDDGHDTGIYSWDTLFELGLNQERNWAEYLEKLGELGYTRQTPPEESGKRRIKLLYFTYLVQKLRIDHEEVELPESVTDVQELLKWLRKSKYEKGYLFAEGSVQLTVNRQFSEPFTKLHDGDEVAVVPTSPNPPPAPK